jgi:glucan biosynthesis protein C
MDWIARRCERRGSILLLAVPLVPVHLLLLAAPGPDHGWGEFGSSSTSSWSAIW